MTQPFAWTATTTPPAPVGVRTRAPATTRGSRGGPFFDARRRFGAELTDGYPRWRVALGCLTQIVIFPLMFLVFVLGRQPWLMESFLLVFGCSLLQDCLRFPRTMGPLLLLHHAACLVGLLVARFGAVGEHWYAGTVQDATRAAEGVFTVAFDDGDVDDAVRREDIRVPRLAGGDRVEALYGATDHYYPATVVGVNSRDGVYRLKFDDGDVLPRAPRTSLRVLDADDRVAAQARRDARARVEAEAARRGALRAAAQQAARADDLAALAGLRRRFERARAVDGKDAVAAAFRATAARTRAPDPHAANAAGGRRARHERALRRRRRGQ